MNAHTFRHAWTTATAAAFLAQNAIALEVHFDPLMELNIQATESGIELSWHLDGALESAPTPSGPWVRQSEKSPSILTSDSLSDAEFFRVNFGAHAHPLGRPVTVHVPDSYRPETPMPLILLLHAYNGQGATGVEDRVKFLQSYQEWRFLYVTPEGLWNNTRERRYWNATDACCAHQAGGEQVDDSGYLRAVIEGIQARLNVDPKRIYVMGLGSGAFMAHRMACDHADLIAAIAAHHGVNWNNRERCQPSQPISILQMHGTSDEWVNFDGGRYIDGPEHPGVIETAEQWALINNCVTEIRNGPRQRRLNLVDGPESDSYTFRFFDCDLSVEVELWVILNGTSALRPSTEFRDLVLDWLYRHAKP